MQLRRLDRLDPALLGATLALVALGTLAVASATLEGPGTEGLWRTQLLWLAVSLVGAVVVVVVDYRVWAGTALFLHGGVIVLLVAVLFFGRIEGLVGGVAQIRQRQQRHRGVPLDRVEPAR